MSAEQNSAKLLIGTPCYGGMLSQQFFVSVLKLLPVLEQHGITVEFDLPINESLVPRARNAIVAKFLGKPDCSHLLFIDADIGFSPDTVIRLLDRDEPVVASACPMKGIDWERVLKNAGQASSAVQLRDRSMQYAVNLSEQGGGRVVDGFLEVDYAGTGFMLIKRAVFEQMMLRYPDARYVNDIAGYDNKYTRNNFWLFFETMKDPISGRYLSEDFAFCHRWVQEMHGSIFLDIHSTMTHSGTYTFAGSFLSSMVTR